MAIFACSCTHVVQDELYGKGKRVFNLGKTGYKCTVCASKKPLLGTEQKDEKDKEKAKQ